MPRKNSEKAPVDVEALLRSIHVRMDATQPERLGHFRPTSKCVPLLKGLLGQEESRAWLVEAPYGTGKSLVAGYLLHLVENRPSSREMLASVEPRLAEVNPRLGQYAAHRRRQQQQGLALTLEGHETDLPGALQRAILEAMERHKLGREARPLRRGSCSTLNEALELLQTAASKVAAAGFDQISIIWDEFGRHLESLIAAGRGSALSDVQTLAEYAARASTVPVTLGLLLHQNLLQYANRAPQGVRSEWAKIEGRFTSHQYVDDSTEVYRLLADAVFARRATELRTPTRKELRETARRARELGYFADCSLKDVAELLYRAFPLEPTTLALLPRLSARVAQSERTLFAFVHDVDLSAPVSPAELYDYFSSAMRADTAVGGTYRRWIETESALSKLGKDKGSERTLKAACLLGLGMSGERAHASYDNVAFAAGGYDDGSEARADIDNLIDGKLLLYRRHNDQLTVWHGTDLDLRGRLEEIKARERESFQLAEFLTRELPPPTWKPVVYNDAFDLRRYLRGEYLYLTELHSDLTFGQQIEPLSPGEDGKIVYLLLDNMETLAIALEQVDRYLHDDRLVVAVPREPIPLQEAALEVYCLRQLHQDAKLLGDDPLAGAEIEELTDDARANLQRLVDRVVRPGKTGPYWFYHGQQIDGQSARELRHSLSQLMRKVFPLTPRIRNEMINRHRPSRVLVNARKKVMLGLLERHGTPDLGIVGHTPDASIYRTVISKTGLYGSTDGETWRFAQPEDLNDDGLQAVWARLRAFFTEPADEPKAPTVLFHELLEPPYGVRAGLVPILFAASYQAFPAAVAITRDGEYIDDVLPSHIEDLVRQPERYRVKVLPLTEDRRRYLEGVCALFAKEGEEAPEQGDLIRACHDAVEAWRRSLPPVAMTSRTVAQEGCGLQRVLGVNHEPIRLLLEELPQAAGADTANEAAVEWIRYAKEAIERISTAHAQQGAEALVQILQTGSTDSGAAVSIGQDWASCFPNALVRRLPERTLSGLVRRLATPYRTVRQLVDSLAQLLLGKPVNQWDDASLSAFERELETAVRRIEDFALSSTVPVQELGAQAQRLAPLAEMRLKQWHARYRELAGPEAAEATLRDLDSKSTDTHQTAAAEEPDYGDHARCAE